MSRTRPLFLLCLAAFQLLFLAASVVASRTRPQGLIASDGKAYYAWLRSLALDRDLDFRNDFALLYPPDALPDTLERTSRGLVANKYPVGVALAEVPGFVIGHLLALAFRQPTNGVSAPYQFAVTIWLQLLCLAGLALLWLTLVRLGADPAMAAIVVLSALSATNLIQYIARPSMAHGPGVAVLCGALYCAARARDEPGPLWRWGVLGALLGLAVIIRPTNLALAPVFLVLLLDPLGRSLPRWGLLLGAALAVVALQATLMSLLWGEVRISGYVGEGFTAGWAGVRGSLVASRHGLFAYHPWYLVMLAICVAAARQRQTRPLALATLVSFAAFVAINGTWWCWWFGGSFGNRAYIELVPALALVGGLFLGAGRPPSGRRLATVAVSVLVLSLSNALLWSGFILRRYPPEGDHSFSQAYLWPLQQRTDP